MRKKFTKPVVLAAALAAAFVAFADGGAKYDIAAYVWPAYQPDPRWAELGIFADGDGEWQNVREAVPKWEGHRQPLVPLWGYENEADPKVMEKKIDAAVSHGVNVFIYDWYWYGGRPFLEDGLDKGFLGAKNNGKMKFFIMWANHDVTGLWNNKMSTDGGKKDVIWPAKVSDDDFKKIVERWISQYFTRPNYYRIDGKPVLSIFRVNGFVEWDGLAKAKERIEYLRERVKKAGFPGVHLQVVGGWMLTEMKDSLSGLGVDSVTSYSWNDGTWDRINDKTRPELVYPKWGEMWLGIQDGYRDAAKGIGATFFPNLTIGWDTNARYPANEVRRIVRNSNPVDFERFARCIKSWTDSNMEAPMPKLITVNSWNEWTEGSYLEPDTHFKFGYLDAVRRVFVSDGK